MTGAQEQPIAQFHVKDGVTYTVNASSAGKAEREGESTLWLRDNEDTLLASLTFSVARSNGQPVVVIGGLQGPVAACHEMPLNWQLAPAMACFPSVC